MGKLTVEQAKAFLDKKGYAVVNLWCVYDVLDKYDTDHHVALAIINDALQHEKVIETIFEVIDMYAEEAGLKEL